MITYDQYLNTLRESVIGMVGGIYMIGNFYVGRAVNIESRIGQHILGSHNDRVNELLIENYKQEKQPLIRQLSKVEAAEEQFIKRYSIHYDLCNVQFMYSAEELSERRERKNKQIAEIKNALDILYQYNETKYYKEKQEMFIKHYLRLDNRIKDLVNPTTPIVEIKKEIERYEMELGLAFGLPTDFWSPDVKQLFPRKSLPSYDNNFEREEPRDRTFER